MLEQEGNSPSLAAGRVSEVEQCARIVEAFAEGESGETLELLLEIAQAIRDRAFVVSVRRGPFAAENRPISAVPVANLRS